MLHLDKSKPYQITYGEDADKFPFFQDGLYFDRTGNLMNIEHNRDVYAARGLDFASAIAGDVAPVAQTDSMYPKSGAEVFAIADRLRVQLDVEEDNDPYIPTAGARADNVAFIERHAK